MNTSRMETLFQNLQFIYSLRYKNERQRRLNNKHQNNKKSQKQKGHIIVTPAPQKTTRNESTYVPSPPPTVRA